jgi:protein gp37
VAIDMGTKIEWCDKTWNPVTGCNPISTGCDNCYARKMARRLADRCGYPSGSGFDVTLHHDKLLKPLKWKKPKRIFVCSMGDLFHSNVPNVYIAVIFGVMALAKQHTFILLTKRPLIMLEWFVKVKQFSDNDEVGLCEYYIKNTCSLRKITDLLPSDGPSTLWPLPNVWVGVTAENRVLNQQRTKVLMNIPSVVKFISFEPLLSNIDQIRDGIDWVIVGAETGPGARPMSLEWARNIRDQCNDQNIPFFMKKVSGNGQVPDDLLIRQFPNTDGLS